MKTKALFLLLLLSFGISWAANVELSGPNGASFCQNCTVFRTLGGYAYSVKDTKGVEWLQPGFRIYHIDNHPAVTRAIGSTLNVIGGVFSGFGSYAKSVASTAPYVPNPQLSTTQSLYANDGTYLGNTSPNQFDSNSIYNQFGKYGSQFSPNSVNNAFGLYGSQFSPNSPNNQFATPATEVPPYTNYGYQVGGWSNRRY